MTKSDGLQPMLVHRQSRLTYNTGTFACHVVGQNRGGYG
jgi:hypothetical protein